MRVVVTRPHRSGIKTAKLLEDMGHEPVLLPLTEPVHHPEALVPALSGAQGPLVVTSAEAIRVLARLGDNQPHLKRTLFSVGEATTREARRAGFENVITASGNGETLAALIFENRHLLADEDVPLVYLAGAPRSPAFETALATTGIPVHVVECYAMHPVQWSDAGLDTVLLSGPVDAVLLYSAEAARLFFEKTVSERYERTLERTLFACISAQVSTLVPRHFLAHTMASAIPSEAATLALL